MSDSRTGVLLMEDVVTGVSLSVHDGVATIRYDQPHSPVNTLNTRVGPVFEQIFARIEQDASIVGAVLVSGKADTWIAGADIDELRRVTTALDGEALSRGGTGACREAACAILAGTPPSRRLGGAGSPQHDSCAIAWLLAPEAFTTREVFAEVDCGVGPGRGQTLIDRWGRLGRPANALVLETLEAGRFFEVLEQSLSRLP